MWGHYYWPLLRDWFHMHINLTLISCFFRLSPYHNSTIKQSGQRKHVCLVFLHHQGYSHPTCRVDHAKWHHLYCAVSALWHYKSTFKQFSLYHHGNRKWCRKIHLQSCEQRWRATCLSNVDCSKWVWRELRYLYQYLTCKLKFVFIFTLSIF